MLKKITFSVLLTLALLEIALRLGGFYRTYSERIGKGYQSYYNVTYNSWYFTYPPDTSFVADNGDFKFAYTTNSLGLREKEFVEPATDSTIKIITIGDSFTEGVGAPYDSTWPRLLEGDLLYKGINTHVYTAGMGGADPFYEYTLFRDKLVSYKPDMLVMVINSSDFADYLFRGGFERFKADGTTVYKTGPWYEPLWQYSRTVRLAMHALLGFKKGNLFVQRSRMKEEYAGAVAAIAVACDSIGQLCNSIGCNLTVVLHPSPSEVMYRNQHFHFGPWQYKYVSEEARLLADVVQQLDSKLTSKGIPVINLWHSFDTIINTENYLQYTYENDRHFNATGYKIMEGFIIKDLQIATR
ncbi:MAG TPA: SGNH/GDSL hydrolase family protein [Chitinophagales bacterium]|nr:SGNH/GDSL hydrolase family protein [Chitinophagales bacterium]